MLTISGVAVLVEMTRYVTWESGGKVVMAALREVVTIIVILFSIS